MARSARDWVAGAIYHVFSRGSNRQAIFLNDGDYGEFEMLLSSAFRKHELDCFGWSLMPNHWHGVVRCPQGGLSRFMREVNHRYAVRNPVEAGICASPFDARWTSFAATAGIAPAPDYLRVDQILDCFGRDRDAARRRYIQFVVGEPPGEDLHDSFSAPAAGKHLTAAIVDRWAPGARCSDWHKVGALGP